MADAGSLSARLVEEGSLTPLGPLRQEPHVLVLDAPLALRAVVHDPEVVIGRLLVVEHLGRTMPAFASALQHDVQKKKRSESST